MIENSGQLVPHELNPRDISAEQLNALRKSIEAYGDLSGIVFNRRTRKQIGGHQRVKIFGSDCPIKAKYFNEPDKQGTVGLGYITAPDGSKHSYREVDWPKEIEFAAMIAANAHGGEWNDALLRQTLVLISESDQVDPETVGLSQDFTEKLFRGAPTPELSVQQQEKKSLERPLSDKQIAALPSQTAMVQLFFTITTRPPFIELCKKLQVIYGTANISDTVDKAVKEIAEKHGLKASEQ